MIVANADGTGWWDADCPVMVIPMDQWERIAAVVRAHQGLDFNEPHLYMAAMFDALDALTADDIELTTATSDTGAGQSSDGNR